MLRDAGARRVAVEDPGWSAQRETALDAGLEPVPVAVDERGMRVEELDALGVDAVVVTPAHQCPTGAVLAPERRAALLDWARAPRRVVVEDDYDAEYRYDREPVGALQGMAPERVVYAGSVSQDARARRCGSAGWCCPRALAEPAARRRGARTTAAGRCSTQLALADLIARGELDRHLRRTRRRYRARRDALVAAVAAELPGAARRGHRGRAARRRAAAGRGRRGGDRRRGRRARHRARRPRGLLRARRRRRTPALVLGYANIAEPAIARGIAELAGALR